LNLSEVIKINKSREIATQIIDKFEELLSQKRIQIPSQDREGKPEEACLYGSEYYELEDGVNDILKRYIITNHKEIILEALNDYRVWFTDEAEPTDLDQVKKIDMAIKFIRGDGNE